jgi:hypothetical protein
MTTKMTEIAERMATLAMDPPTTEQGEILAMEKIPAGLTEAIANLQEIEDRAMKKMPEVTKALTKRVPEIESLMSRVSTKRDSMKMDYIDPSCSSRSDIETIPSSKDLNPSEKS